MTRIHVVSLPHTLLTRDYEWCAYTAKIRRFIRMLAGRHQALVYGPDVHDCPDAFEYVPIVTEADRVAWFGQAEWNVNEVFNRWDLADPAWVTTNHRAALAIRERWQPGDLIGLIGGLCQKQVVDELVDLRPLVVEWGIGYSGVLESSVKVFESYAWMHHVAGLIRNDEISYFDEVIPNCFHVEDFQPSTIPGEYLLFIGRPNPRKGLPIIQEIIERSNLPVLVAGQPGHGLDGAKYVGVVTGNEKAQLLAGARALLAPTTYLEPFGGVAVEAMLSGTPVIATDWGAFTETVEPGVTGYRCRMLGDFLNAIELSVGIDRRQLVRHAQARYSTVVGADRYDAYLNRVATLYGEGWYTPSGSAARAMVDV